MADFYAFRAFTTTFVTTSGFGILFLVWHPIPQMELQLHCLAIVCDYSIIFTTNTTVFSRCIFLIGSPWFSCCASPLNSLSKIIRPGFHGPDILPVKVLKIRRASAAYIPVCSCWWLCMVCAYITEVRWWMHMGLSVRLILTTSRTMSSCHITCTFLLGGLGAGQRWWMAAKILPSLGNVTPVSLYKLTYYAPTVGGIKR